MMHTNETVTNGTEIMSNTTEDTSTETNTMGIVHSVIASVGIVTNLTVIVVFSNHRQLRRKVPNICIINQSLLDFAVSVVLFLSTLTMKNRYKVHSKGIVAWIECRIWNSNLFLWGFFVSSTWNIVVLTIERYLELVHPIWHKAHFDIRYFYASLVFVWVFGFLINVYNIPTSKVVNDDCLLYTFWPNNLFKNAYGVFVFCITFLIPLIILIFCYEKIVWVLTRRIDSNLSGTKSNKFELARTNTIKTLLLVALCFVVCWASNQVYYLMFNLGFNVDWNSSFYQSTVVMAFLNCTINPFIYLAKYQDFQTALKSCCGSRKSEDGRNTELSPGSVSQVSSPIGEKVQRNEKSTNLKLWRTIEPT